MKPNAEDYPIQICGIAWRELKKGQIIDAEKVEEMYFLLSTKGFIPKSNHSNRDISFRSLQVKEWIDESRVSIGKPLVIKQDKGSLYILTDEEAVSYLDKRAYTGLNIHKRATRKMFNRIDEDNLSQYDKDRLHSNQGRHAFISSAVDGAKKQVVRIEKDGGTIPKIKPPDED